MKAYNLESKNGRAVANQFVLKEDNRKVFQSYDSTIVEVKWHSDFCEVNIGYDWDHSRTTIKYLKVFLINEIGLVDKEVETIKKQLRKGHDFITIGRFVIRYYEGMR